MHIVVLSDQDWHSLAYMSIISKVSCEQQMELIPIKIAYFAPGCRLSCRQAQRCLRQHCERGLQIFLKKETIFDHLSTFLRIENWWGWWQVGRTYWQNGQWTGYQCREDRSPPTGRWPTRRWRPDLQRPAAEVLPGNRLDNFKKNMPPPHKKRSF